MDIATATPVEIDTELGRLYTEAFPHRQQIDASRTAVHMLIKGTEGKTELNLTTYVATEDRARKLVAELPRLLAQLDAARADLAPLEAAEKPLEAEYEARGRWSRFFLVTSSDGGHIHSSMSCSTCNNGVYRTQFHWMPEFSGMTMTEAIAAWDERGSSEILCTVCFPDAPVARTVAQVPDTQCPGSGTWDYPRETARLNYYTGNYGICRHCEQAITVSKTGKMRKHDKTPAAPKVSAEKLAKAITPDGSELKITDAHGSRQYFKTEVSATNWAVSNIGSHRAFGYRLSEEGVKTVIEALATKHGKTVAETTELIEGKVKNWLKRNARG
jgi:hypothetical protein